jgi:hypothetical protein
LRLLECDFADRLAAEDFPQRTVIGHRRSGLAARPARHLGHPKPGSADGGPLPPPWIDGWFDHSSAPRIRWSERPLRIQICPDVSVWCRRGDGTTRSPARRAHDMGTYLFERYTGEGAGRGASASLQDDVATALREIDWVENFAIHAESGTDEVIGVDVSFDAEWPDIRTSNPDQVSVVFRHLGLRTIAQPALTGRQTSADDPLSANAQVEEDDEAFDLFQFDE